MLFALLALSLVCGGIELGNWQLRRAAQKEALQAELDAKGKLPALEQDAFLALDDARKAMHQPVRLRGLWLTPQTVYLDNRQMHGVPGFYVLTPFALLDTKQTILVQRGWIQRNFDSRETLQPVETPTGLVEIAGVVAAPPAHLLELGKAADSGPATAAGQPAGTAGEPSARPAAPASVDAPADKRAEKTAEAPGDKPVEPSAAPVASQADGAPAATPAASPPVGFSAIRQNLDLEAYRTETGLPLRTDVTLQQTGAASQGLQRDWPAPALGIERHYGYAFQWFGLSALVAILYVWFQFIVPLRRRRRARRR